MTTGATSIRAEIADLERYLEGLPSELRAGPYADSYRSRLHMLLEQLSTEELEEVATLTSSLALDLRITSEHAPDEHRISAQFLGDFLQRWQTLFSALGQAAAGKPTSRGLIPAEILRETSLNVVAYAQGSFVTRLVLGEPPQTKLPETDRLGALAFEHFEQICAAGANHHELSILLQQLKGRVLSAYTKLLELLASNGASLELAMAEPRKAIKRIRIERISIDRILPMLGNVSFVERTEQDLMGFLNAANRRTGAFEIDLGEEGTITGRVADSDTLEGVVIGRLYEFKLSQNVTKDPLTGSHDASWVLLGTRMLEE